MNTRSSEVLGCSLFVHHLILQTRCKPIKRRGRAHQPGGTGSTAPGLRPAPAGGWGRRAAAARSTGESCQTTKRTMVAIRPSPPSPEPTTTTALPGESPAGPRTSAQLQRRVVTYLLSGADWPGLQDVLHQVTIATNDVQRVNDGLPGLICGESSSFTKVWVSFGRG